MHPDAPRARRRAQLLRTKARARRVMRLWAGRRSAPPDPRQVGRNASTHCRACSCFLCQPDPEAVPPPRERRFHDDEL